MRSTPGAPFLLEATLIDNGRAAFVHQTAIQMDGFHTLEQGQRVSYDEEQTERGIMAINVNVQQ